MGFAHRIARAGLAMAAAVARAAPWRTGDGVIGVVFTPAGRLVLVRHTHLGGWHPPGGGRKRRETPREAVVRELREEIGLATWSSIEPVDCDEAGLRAFVVRDAIYRPRRTLEIERVEAFDAVAPPAGTSPRLIRLLASLRRG